MQIFKIHIYIHKHKKTGNWNGVTSLKNKSTDVKNKRFTIIKKTSLVVLLKNIHLNSQSFIKNVAL